MNNQVAMIYQPIDHQQQNNQDNQPKYGNNILICSPKCMLGPHYYVFIPTFILLSILLIVLFIQTKNLLSSLWSLIISISIVLWMISYLLIGFSNPGIVTNKNVTNTSPSSICHQCGVIKQQGVRHCKDCNCCIYGYDHHCPWIGKCVGQENKGKFYFFLLMMFGVLLLFFIGTISSAENVNTTNQ